MLQSQVRHGIVSAAAALLLAAVIVPPGVQQRRLWYEVKPVYPRVAREARIQGSVKFTALIAPNGTVSRLQLISGHPLLVKSAMDAARQWRYLPMGVEIITEIVVNFSLWPPPDSGRRLV
jgi:protein TonB